MAKNMGKAVSLFLLTAIAMCQATYGFEEDDAPLPHSDYRDTAPDEIVYRVDSSQTQILVRVGRGGLVKRLGHEHSVASEDVQGYVLISEEQDNSHADLVFPLSKLLVDEASHRKQLGLKSTPSAKDIAGTQANMMKVLSPDQQPWVLMKVRWAEPGIADVTISMSGASSNYRVPVTLNVNDQQLEVSGQADIRHSDFGLKPFKAVGGLLRVADELQVTFRLVALAD